MSGENVEAVKAFFAAFAERDFEAGARLLDPGLKVRPAIVGGPEGTVYHGPAGMKQFWADVDSAWSEFRIAPEEFRDLGATVLVLGRAHARGRDSGIVLDTPAAWIVGVREGRIVAFQSFSRQHDALEAAGLEE